MKTYRVHSIMFGLLYIMGTVFGVLAAILAGGTVPNDIMLISENLARFELSVLLLVFMGFSLSAMAAFTYPVFRHVDRALAMGVVIFRGALEGSGYILSAIGWLFLVGLGSELMVTGVDSLTLTSMADRVIWMLDKFSSIFTLIFIIGASMLYVLFYRSRLIPRWLSLWGLIAAVPYVVPYLLGFFDIASNLELLTVPLALQEMVMALWLIIRGFDADAIQSYPHPNA